jgi:hypothetical protein
MKASKAIEYLSELDPNEEIIIDWWDRSFTTLWDEEGNELDIPAEVWEFVVKQIGEREHLMEQYSEAITQQIYNQYKRTQQ